MVRTVSLTLVLSFSCWVRVAWMPRCLYQMPKVSAELSGANSYPAETSSPYMLKVPLTEPAICQGSSSATGTTAAPAGGSTDDPGRAGRGCTRARSPRVPCRLTCADSCRVGLPGNTENCQVVVMPPSKVYSDGVFLASVASVAASLSTTRSGMPYAPPGTLPSGYMKPSSRLVMLSVLPVSRPPAKAQPTPLPGDTAEKKKCPSLTRVNAVRPACSSWPL